MSFGESPEKEQVLNTHPGILSGPGDFCGFICLILCATSADETVNGKFSVIPPASFYFEGSMKGVSKRAKNLLNSSGVKRVSMTSALHLPRQSVIFSSPCHIHRVLTVV